MKKNLLVVVLVLLVGSFALAATTMTTSGDYADALNWDNGLPTLANPGLIPVGISGDYAGTANLDGVDLTVQGTWTKSGNNGFDFSGGTIITVDGGTFDQTGGWDLDNNGGGFKLIDGTILTNRFRFRNTSVTNTILDGTWNTGGDTRWLTTGVILQFLTGGTGNVVTNIARGNWDGEIVDFQTGNLGELTIGGYTEAQFITAFDSGILTVDGAAQTAGTFASHFQVDGSTVSLIPEPATMALLGLGSLVTLRRRK